MNGLKTAILPPVRVEAEVKAEYERLAQESRRTLSDYIRVVLTDHLKKIALA